MFLTVAMGNTHIFMPEIISTETLQAFNNTAAKLKKEGGCQKPHYTVGSLIYSSPAVWEHPFVFKKIGTRQPVKTRERRARG